MDQVRRLTSRRAPVTTEWLIEELNPLLRGWGHYYKRAHVRKLFNRLDRWIVRRIWSHRYKRWRNHGWKQLRTSKPYGELGLVNLVGLIPSIAAPPPTRQRRRRVTPLERRAEEPRSKARGATLISPRGDAKSRPKGPRPLGRRDRGAGRGRSGGAAAGIPTVMDRLVQQALLQVLQSIFDPLFSESSYGSRPGRSAHDAVRAAQGYVREGRDWVVDLDIAKFFDHVHHDILMRRVAQGIRDKRVLRLIGRYLRAGVLVDGVVVGSEEGTPQGGPLSPLLANIYLDALDRELESRGLRFCRYADDCAPRAQRGPQGPRSVQLLN